MKKIISMLLVVIISIVPMLSLNCFATGEKGQIPVAATKNVSSTANNDKNSSKLWNAAKKAAIASLVIASAAMVIHKFGLEEATGKGFRLSVDYFTNAFKILPSVVKNIWKSFSKPGEITVTSNVFGNDLFCDSSSSWWTFPTEGSCLQQIKNQLSKAYLENIDLFNDQNTKYSLVFKRV